jgi:hypothetical protein
MLDDAARHLDWMTAYRPKVETWLPNGLDQLDKLIDGIGQMQAGNVSIETSQQWLHDFVTWREVYHSRLHNHYVTHIALLATEPKHNPDDAAALVQQSIALVMSCQKALNRAGSAMGTHALASLIAWQATPSWANLMKAMHVTDRAVIESEGQ